MNFVPLMPGTHYLTADARVYITHGGVYHIQIDPVGVTESVGRAVIVCVLRGDCSVTLTTRQEHHHAHTRSHIQVYGLIYDQARVDYESMISMGAHAHQAEAHQASHIVLMDQQARARTRPAVEIIPNTVSCHHASAVGPLDDSAVHYLLARGLHLAQARHELAMSFLRAQGVEQALLTELER